MGSDSNPLDEAIRVNDTVEALRLIADGRFVRTQDADRHTALYWAAMRGRLAVVDALIAAGAELEAETIDGATPLSAAVAGGHLDVVRRLLANGANPNGAAVHALTALHVVAVIGDPDLAVTIATLLIEAGADPLAPAAQFEGLSPLAMADAEHPGFTMTLAARGVLRGRW